MTLTPEQHEDMEGICEVYACKRLASRFWFWKEELYPNKYRRYCVECFRCLNGCFGERHRQGAILITEEEYLTSQVVNA